MYVVEVIPFSRTAPAGTLSYRSRESLAEGTIVEVSLRRRMVQGLVVGCQSVAEAKASLKVASFMLTKTVPHTLGTLPEQLGDAAARIARLHAATLGSTLASLFGEHIRSDLPMAQARLNNGEGFSERTSEGPLAARAAEYRKLIESNISTASATLLVVPTIAETEFWRQEFADCAPLVLSSALTGKRREAALAKAVSAGGLIISTPSFSWTPIPSLVSIIIERTGAGSYRAPKRPYLDFRIALTELARARALSITYGDYPLPLEYRAKPAASLPASSGIVTILDLRREKVESPKPKPGEAVVPEKEQEPWTAVSKEMRETLAHTLDMGGRALVIAVRKGYAPSVVCRDCGTSRTDEFGNVLTFTKEGPHGRAFRSVNGRIDETVNVLCAYCGSWNLMPLGVGVERVEEELREAFSDNNIIRFDGDTVRSLSMAKKALEHAHEEGTIIVGTEGALPWLLALHADPFDLSVIASADSLLALPFWRARERFVRLGLLLSTMAQRTILGTRLPEDSAVGAVSHADTTTFFEEELGLRKVLGYPPFGTLIALQAEATRSQLDALDTTIREAIGTHTFTVLPDRALTRTQLRRSYVIQLPEYAWPDVALSAHLRALPPSVRILIDPEMF